MQWALLAVIVVALFLLAGRYPKLAFGLFGAIVVAISSLLFFSREEAEIRRGKIDPEDVMVQHVSSVPAYGGGYRITGRIGNHHSHVELKEVVLSIVVEDCDDTGCQPVGQQEERINLRVPAGQVRDFSMNVYLGEVAISGTIGWQLTVTGTRS